MGIFKKKSAAETLTDLDGNVYKTIKIGKQLWMAENLKVTRYRNGDEIPNEIDRSTWEGLSTGARCVYDNDESKAAVYGYLYNWYAVEDPRNIAPPSWHVPTDEEWQTLLKKLGGESVAGGKMMEAGTSHWKEPNEGATNESGFSAFPGGYRLGNGFFYFLGSRAFFWSSSEYNAGHAWAVHLENASGAYRDYHDHKLHGFSVRLIKD